MKDFLVVFGDVGLTVSCEEDFSAVDCFLVEEEDFPGGAAALALVEEASAVVAGNFVVESLVAFAEDLVVDDNDAGSVLFVGCLVLCAAASAIKIKSKMTDFISRTD